MAIHSVTTANSSSLSITHGSWPATIATTLVSAALAPLAHKQFGDIGAIAVVAFAVPIIGSVWMAAWGAAKLAKRHPQLAGLFASSGIRMVAPLAIAVVVAIGNGRIVPMETLYYLVPLYLCMLLADVLVWVRETKGHGHSSTKSGEVS